MRIGPLVPSPSTFRTPLQRRWVVANVRERSEEEALREGLSTYLVYDDNSQSGGQGGGES